MSKRAAWDQLYNEWHASDAADKGHMGEWIARELLDARARIAVIEAALTKVLGDEVDEGFIAQNHGDEYCPWCKNEMYYGGKVQEHKPNCEWLNAHSVLASAQSAPTTYKEPERCIPKP